MEPIIKSEPCEYLYKEQNIDHQKSSEIDECNLPLQQSRTQNNLKRSYDETKDNFAVSSNAIQQQKSYCHQFEFPDVPHNIKASFSNHESVHNMITSDGKPSKRYKRLEDNVLFNPPFFYLVDDLEPVSKKDAVRAKCCTCDRIVKGNRGISSNYIKHMKRSHPEVYNLYEDYKSHKIKTYHLSSFAKSKQCAPLNENGASGSDSTIANSNDDTNQFSEVNNFLDTTCLNDSSDDNEDSITATKEIVETIEQSEFSQKNLENLESIIDRKMNGYVKQKEYSQLNEKVNALSGRCEACIVGENPSLTELKTELDKLKKECSELHLAVQKTRASKRQLQVELQAVERVLYQRKLIIRNIPLCDSKKPLQAVENLFKEKMHLEDVKIVSCTILPSTNTSLQSKKETVSIELSSAQDCKTVFRQVQKLKNTGIFIEPEISPLQRKRKNKLMVLRKELLRRKPDLKILVRDTTLIISGKKFYWDDVEGLCHDCKYENSSDLNGAEYLKSLCDLDLKEFITVLQNYNIQVT